MIRRNIGPIVLGLSGVMLFGGGVEFVILGHRALADPIEATVGGNLALLGVAFLVIASFWAKLPVMAVESRWETMREIINTLDDGVGNTWTTKEIAEKHPEAGLELVKLFLERLEERKFVTRMRFGDIGEDLWVLGDPMSDEIPQIALDDIIAMSSP